MKYAPPETRIEIPSKVFLLGEYICLVGAPALVAAIRPGFTYLNHKNANLRLPVGSPGQRLVQKDQVENVLRLGPESGGLGASTADFLYLYRQEGITECDLNSIWRKYRDCSQVKEGAALPSGLDLASQIMGGLSWYWIDDSQKKVQQRLPAPKFFLQEFSLHLFLAAHLPGQKTATHVELEKLNADHRLSFLQWAERNSFKESCIHQIEENFPDWMNRVAEWAQYTKLEHSRTTDIRSEFKKIDGVLAVKGCGGGFSDVILVALKRDPSTSSIDKLRGIARKMGLQELGKLPDELALGWMEREK